jgi:iron complex outermembrane receptor protein
MDPYEIRNLGPSRTLILINGKRKNMSALLYTQTSPGRGETGADISAIPTDAIERVEILRDGASAQYGSDAIAGVMNIILKKGHGDGSVTVRTGITTEGDGEMLGVSVNNGTTVGDKGFLNYTLDFSKVNLANRPGTVDANAEFNYWGGTDVGVNTMADINNFLSKNPDAGNINGSPETAAAKFLINGGTDLNDHTQFYYNAAYIYKKVNSFANYRTPYWKPVTTYPQLLTLYGDGTNVASYQGYAPTFEGNLNDYNATAGFKSNINDWNTDASITVGGNEQLYTVDNSVNLTRTSAPGVTPITFLYGAASPVTFKAGGTAFNHIVGNIDISKVVSDKISIGFGSEFRTENLEIIAGDDASYIGLGADSFAGNRKADSGKFNRYNFGAYFDVAYDITKDFLVNGTVRYEDYSDFGNATVWKLSSRYKFLDDKVTLRGSISTGFRAPSLHQLYIQKAEYSFGSSGIEVTEIINNSSTRARVLNVPKLTAEKSNNITLGFGLKPTKNISFTFDYYNIEVKDRIVLSNKIQYIPGGNKESFFVNAIDSKTSGIDFVFNYRNIQLGSGKLAVNVSGNYTLENGLDGEVRNLPAAQALGKSVFNATQESLMFTSRPEFKYILGGDYEVGKFVFSLNNTIFGPTTFKNADYSDPGLYTKFKTKAVTDLGINFSATEKLTLSLNINNIFNVLPEYEIKSDGSATANAIVNDPAKLHSEFTEITFNGRYSQMTYDGYHFSQLGTMFNLSLNYKF